MLLQGLILENKKKDLRVALVTAGILLFFGFIHSFPIVYDFFNGFNICIAFVVASMVFKRLASPSASISYMMIPASTFEKTVATIVYVQVYMLFVITVFSLAGAYLGVTFSQLYAVATQIATTSEFSYPSVTFANFGPTLLAIYFLQSIAVFGSVYFRKLALLKMLLVYFAYGFVVMLVLMGVAFAVADSYVFSGRSLVQNFSDEAIQAAFYIALTLGTLFFWFMTYLRHRETEA